MTCYRDFFIIRSEEEYKPMRAWQIYRVEWNADTHRFELECVVPCISSLKTAKLYIDRYIGTF